MTALRIWHLAWHAWQCLQLTCRMEQSSLRFCRSAMRVRSARVRIRCAALSRSAKWGWLLLPAWL